MAGLLTCFVFNSLPGNCQWRGYVKNKSIPLYRINEAHSYGDSSGLAPVFPINTHRVTILDEQR